MILRNLQSVASNLFKQYQVVTITGPRQSGKTTQARTAFDLDGSTAIGIHALQGALQQFTAR